MLNRVFVVLIVGLALLSVHQYNRIDQLQEELAVAQKKTIIEARALAAESMEGQAVEIEHALAWLDDYYKSPEGLQRPQGLSIDGRPDFPGIGVWIFDKYLLLRLRGATEETARKAVADEIRRSQEWRSKHPQP